MLTRKAHQQLAQALDCFDLQGIEQRSTHTLAAVRSHELAACHKGGPFVMFGRSEESSSAARRQEVAQYTGRGLTVPADIKYAWSRPKEDGGKLVEGGKKLRQQLALGDASFHAHAATKLHRSVRPGYRVHDPGERTAQAIVETKVAAALNLMKEMAQTQAQIKNAEKEDCKRQRQAQNDACDHVPLQSSASFHRSRGTSTTVVSLQDHRPLESISVRPLYSRLHALRRELHRLVKVKRVKNGVLLESSSIQVILWAGYGDPRGQQTECTQAVRDHLIYKINTVKKNTNFTGQGNEPKNQHSKKISLIVSPSSLGCFPPVTQLGDDPVLTIVYLGTSEVILPSKITCGLMFHPQPPSSSHASSAEEGITEVGFSNGSSTGFSLPPVMPSPLVTSSGTESTDWSVMVDYVDDAQLWQVLNDYQATMNGASRGAFGAWQPEAASDAARSGFKEDIPSFSVNPDALERLHFSLEESFLACSCNAPSEPAIKFLFVVP
jgi:hypothetical protein